MRRLVIIDGKSVFYRGYYAMGNLALSDGTPTGGIYGFAAIAMEIVKRLNPSQVVVAWDSKTSSAKRKAIFADYKAGRVKPGDDFYAQIPLLKELIIDLGWEFIEVDEYEADDIIGTLSKQADETLGADGKCEYETYIVSSDLDMLQIVDDNTKMCRILKGFSEIEEIDVKEVEAKYGILKSQFLDLKALKGDNSDNIPGVPGIGEKTAVKLLNEYGSVDGIYEHLDEIKGSTRDKLAAGKESAYMSLKLAQIMFDAPVSLSSVPEFEFNRERVVERLKKLQFNSLIRKFGLEGLQTAEPAKTEVKVEELPKDTVVAWDVKTLMHEDAEAATKILMGMPFWDLAQGAFLLDPLAREIEQKDVKIAYSMQKQAFLQRPELYKIFVQFDQPLIPVLYKMEKKGMLIDREYFAKLKDEYTEEVARKEREIQLMAGVDFNVNSPVQLSEVLFDKMGLPTKGIKKTSRGYSTGAKELDKLRNEHPIIEKLMEYREAAKLLSTYITPMPELADEEGRIHTTFTQNVTATGRLSSLNPNLQNIPVRTEEGKRIREGFVAPKGRVLVSADYSQFELRLAAVLSDDKALIDDFNAGIDIHTKTASEAFGVPLDQVTKAQRRAAKVINFGVLYGMSVKGLADAAGMSIGDAKAFIEKYFELRAPIKKKLEEILKQAREKGYVETFFGRRRPTPDVKSSNFLVRAAAERAAQNMPIQGTEADLMKRAMVEVDKKLPKGAELIMQVHDSLIVECDENLAKEVETILKETMEGVAPELKIKLAVDVTVGHNWGEL
ncbi:MAG: DNA polymerase [Candidatus Saccharibacteria bacterium]|nr:DNA polymerase [Candidatus Saccharibacteria bacterium]